MYNCESREPPKIGKVIKMQIQICYDCLMMIDRADKTSSEGIREGCLLYYYGCCFPTTEASLIGYAIGVMGIQPLWNDITRSEVLRHAMNDDESEVGM